MPEKEDTHSGTEGVSPELRKRAEALLAKRGADTMGVRGESDAKEWEQLARQLLKMVEELPVGAVYVDREKLLMNRVAEEITGYSKDELRTLDQWFKALYGNQEGEIRQLYESRYAEGFPGPETVELVRKNGERRLVTFVGHRFDGHAVWILHDETEQKIAANELSKSEERLRAILNAAVDAIITINREGSIVDINPSTERIFGYAERELLGQSVSILMPSPYREELVGYLARRPEVGELGKTGISREGVGRRKDGSIFPVDLSVSEVDHLGFYTGIIRDITDRKRAQEAARIEHEFSENLIETTQSIILVLDSNGRIVRFNSVLERLTGWSLEEVEGGEWFEIFLPERDRDRIRKLFGQAIGGTSTRGNVNAILTKSGDERSIEWYDAPLKDHDGKLVGLISSGIDVTDRRELEQQVYRASEEEKIRIAGDLHDSLGSMLTGIGYLTGAMSGKLHRGQAVEAKEADAILKNVYSAINQTRSLARGLHGVSDDPDALPVALRELAIRIRSTSELKCRFVSPRQRITISDSIAANHIFRIAQEAVNNAVRHSGASCVTIQIKAHSDGLLILRVVDNGWGFNTEDPTNGGLGLRTMEYRARAIGANLTISRRTKGGTVVECVYGSR